MQQRTYPALQVLQTDGGRPIVLFSAPVTEIEEWAGVPQKKSAESHAETTGFQRDENEKRIDALASFLKTQKNVLQNPLLCATQRAPLGVVQFIPIDNANDGNSLHGRVTIEWPDFSEMTLLELLRMLKDQLEHRLPTLAGHHVGSEKITRLKLRANIEFEVVEDENADESSDETIESETALEEDVHGDESAAAALSDESHILEFWEDVVARIAVLEDIREYDSDTFLGFSRDAVTAFLKPIVVMDGQHRLRGALRCAFEIAESAEFRDEVHQRVEGGEDPDQIQSDIKNKVSRWLPVSLLLEDDPAEHVFQFVIVNQKATPIGRALLGTIVSTTLSNAEIDRVSTRLSDSKIPLDQSRAVAYLTRNDRSPFRNRVQTGMLGEDSGCLAWSVMASLVRVFQDLKGGRLYGDNIDFADKWRRDLMPDSDFVARYEDAGYEEPFEYWRSAEGPWREVFIRFYSKIQNEFGKADEESWAYWGNPKKSNLYNKISLTILAADFFQFMVERQRGIDSHDEVSAIVEEWLTGVSRDYFNRDWQLSNQKKDNLGIRKNWAKLWRDYRKDPVRLPLSSQYKKGISV